MAKQTISNVTIEDARIVFRNFAGAEQQYNRAGDRNFALILDDELAARMQRDGWNVKHLKPREEGDEPTPYIQVSVSYKGRPPRIVLIGSVTQKKTPLDESTVEVLDYADIVNVDVIVNPYQWEVNGKSGIKAYCQSLFVTINEDELELKYSKDNGD